MTMMPSLHVRDPRRRYRANQIRKRVRPAVPPLVVPDPVITVPEDLIEGLVKVNATTRLLTIQRLGAERGPDYAEAVLAAVAAALREKRKKP